MDDQGTVGPGSMLTTPYLLYLPTWYFCVPEQLKNLRCKKKPMLQSPYMGMSRQTDQRGSKTLLKKHSQ